MNIQFIIRGEVPPKKNLYRVGNGNFYLPKQVNEYQKSFNVQCREQLGAGYSPVTHHVALHATFYVKRQKDLDNLLNGLLDALQGAKVIENDGQVTYIKAAREKDTRNPRVEITITNIDV